MTGQTTDGRLTVAAQAFASNIERLVVGCLPNAPTIEVEQLAQKLRIKPAGQDNHRGGLPLEHSGQTLAWLRVSYLCRMDGSNTYLAIDASKISVVAEGDRAPLFRFEYVSKPNRVPSSHIHVHGQRPTLTRLLAETGHASTNMHSLHLPTGGARFRPELEDVIEFLLDECHFDGKAGWQNELESSRVRWLGIQLRTATRASPGDAVAQLRSMGYTVVVPES